MIALMDPKTSWCSKWLHLRKHVPGCYALWVHQELPQHIEDILENEGVKWKRPE